MKNNDTGLEREKELEEANEKQKKWKKNLLYDGILLAGILLVLCAGIGFYQKHKDYEKSNDFYDKLSEQYVSKHEVEGLSSSSRMETEEQLEVPWYQMIDVNLRGLKRLNGDVIGWIFFENEDISYPILYSGDDETYLRTTLDGESATSGSIFLEGANTPDFQDSRTIICGHNMRNLSMFGKLKYYYQQEDYYEGHQYFQVFTEEAVYRYQIFSYFEISELQVEMCMVSYKADSNFADFIQLLYQKSYRDTDVKTDENDKIVTLLTCSSKGKRLLVNAVRVDSYGRNESPHASFIEENILQIKLPSGLVPAEVYETLY